LISTESFVSLPLTGQKGAVLSLRSHFLEFVPRDSKGETLLAHELGEGGRYSLAVTTGGGQRAGDIKPVALHAMGDWSHRFEGGFVDAEG
jgi:GH3 auxin-responsive promoter